MTTSWSDDQLAEAEAFDHAFLHGLGHGHELTYELAGAPPFITTVRMDAPGTPIDREKILAALVGPDLAAALTRAEAADA